MSTLPLANTFEGGSNGTTITTGNSGGSSGNAFDSIAIFTNLTYSSTVSRGTLSAKTVNSSNNWGNTVNWNFTGPASGNSVYGRVYAYTASVPAANNNHLNLITFDATTGNRHFAAAFGTTGKFGLSLYSGGASFTTGTYTYLANTWYRLEIQVYCHATLGQVTGKIYLGDSSSEIETVQTAANLDTSGLTSVNAGGGVYTSQSTFNVYIDDLAANATGWLGPTVTQITDSDTITNTEGITDRVFGDTDVFKFFDTTKKGSFPVWVSKVVPGVNEIVFAKVVNAVSVSWEIASASAPVSTTNAVSWLDSLGAGVTAAVAWAQAGWAVSTCLVAWATKSTVNPTQLVSWSTKLSVHISVAVTWSQTNPPTGSFVDTFTSDTLDSRWITVSGTMSLASDQLTLPSSGTAYVRTAFAYDFTSSYVQAKVDVSGVDATRNVHLRVEFDTSLKYYGFRYTNGVLNWIQDNTSLLNPATYDATSMAYWRIRESLGTIYWDTSPDGNTWTNRKTSPTNAITSPDDMTAAAIRLYAASGSGSPIFDDLNIGTSVVAPTTQSVTWSDGAKVAASTVVNWSVTGPISSPKTSSVTWFDNLYVPPVKTSSVTWFDNLYVPPTTTSSVDWIVRNPMSAISDTFDSLPLHSHWTGVAHATIESGRLKLTSPVSDYSDLGRVTTGYLYDLDWSSISVQVIPPPDPLPAGYRAYMTMNSQAQVALGVAPFEMGIESGNLNFGSEGGAPSPGSVVYDRVSMAYWRLRESGSTRYWDTSPDGAAWTNRASMTGTYAPDAYLVELATDGFVGSTYFDNLLGLDTGKVLPPLTSAVTWVDSYKVSATQAVTWADKVIIAQTQSVSWTTTQSTAQTFSVSYTVNQLTANANAVSWLASSFTSSTVSSSWTVKASVTTSTSVAWDVLIPVAPATSSVDWTINAFTVKTSSDTWTANTLVSVTSSITFNVKSAVDLTANVIYTTRELVFIEAATSWGQTQLVSISSGTEWLTNTVVSSVTSSVSWTQAHVTAKSQSVSFLITELVDTDSDVDWLARESLLSTSPVDWQTLESLSSASDVAWTALQDVSQTITVGWFATLITATESSVEWLELSYGAANFETTWAIAGLTSSDHSASWTDLELVLETDNQDWTVRALASSGESVAWDVLTPVDATDEVTWDLSAHVTETVADIWTVKALISQSEEVSWLQNVTVESFSEFEFLILAEFSSASSVSWLQNSIVLATRVISWSDNSISSVSFDHSVDWESLQLISLSTSSTWTDARETSEAFDIVWSLTQLADTASDVSWTDLAIVGQSQYISFENKASLQEVYTVSFDVHFILTSEFTTLWSVQTFSTVVGQTLVAWIVRESTASGWNLSWTDREAVSFTSDTGWIDYAPLIEERSVQWIAKSMLSTTREADWLTLHQLSDQQSLDWLVSQGVGASQSETWSVHAFTSTSRPVTWQIYSTTAATRVILWRVYKFDFTGARVYGFGSTRELTVSTSTQHVSSTGTDRQLGVTNG